MSTLPGRQLAGTILGLLACSSMLVGSTGIGSSYKPEFTIDDWQTDDGLPQSSVKSIVQTPDGFLWLATFNGLVRFDGVRFTVFDTSNLPGLPNNRIVGLTVDRAGVLWIVSEFNDLARLEDGRCRTLTAADGLPADGVDWVGEDGQGGIWAAGARHGLHSWQNGKFVPAAVPTAFGADPVDHLIVDGSGGTWFQQGPRVYGLKAGRFKVLPGPGGRGEAEVDYACASSDGGLWVVTPAGLRKYRHGQWTTDVWARPDIRTVIVGAGEDAAANLWVASYGSGLFRFSLREGWTRLGVEAGLTTISLRSLFADREGNAWVGTDGGGLLRVKPRLWRMITSREGLGIAAVHSISQDVQGRIWFVGGTSTPYGLKDGAVSAAIRAPQSDLMQGVWSVLGSRSGATWIGTYRGKVFRYDAGKVTEYGESEGMRAGSVRALMEVRSGAIWVGGVDGLSRIERAQVTHYSVSDGLSSGRIQALAEDSHGNLYIGTADRGLNRLAGGRFTVFGREQGLPDSIVASLYMDADDALWIGTHGGGLSRFDGRSFFNFLPAKGGLPVRSVGPMLEDGDGFLWMSSNVGILRTNRKELNEFAAGVRASVSYVVFDRSDGLATVEVGGIQPACLKARDGTLWFGTAKGAAYVNPRDLRVNALPPPVLIDEVRVDDQVIQEAGSDVPRPVSLVTMQPSQRRLDIRFTGFSYAAPTRVQFRYRMENFDPDWVDAGTVRGVSYTRLPPGQYRFRVTARNNDGVWNSTGTSLTVVVNPAFYQSWWFVLTVVAAAVGLISIVFVVRVSRLKQIAGLRARIAGDLHDEVGSNLGGIILLSGMSKDVPDLPAEAQESLEEIHATAQRTANAVRDIVWFLNPEFDTLPDMVVRMREFARTLLVGTDCRFAAPADLPAARLPLEFRRNVFFAFKEILHNVRKHAAATRVAITVSVAVREITLRVEDNGSGFDTAASSTGHGLRSLRQRAADAGGTVTVESGPGKGTRVTLTARIP